MDKNIEILQEVLDLLEDEKTKLYDLVDQNDFRIKEINSYLEDITKKEEDDFKVFSPRNVQNTYREQIEADTSEKKKYKEENVEYNKKIEYLKILIDKVNVVIESLQIEKDSEKQQVTDSKNETGTIRSLVNESDDEKEHIAHQILNCVSFIISDAQRAKIELTALAKKISEH